MSEVEIVGDDGGRGLGRRAPLSKDTKREVDNYREQIAAKNVEIADLNRQIENVGKDGVSGGTQMG